jgi:hypothetical protein
MNVTTGGQRTWLVTAASYAVLFLLGVVQAIIGSFQYGRAAKPVPVAALVCCAVILATCLLGAWAMRSASGAIVPGMGWIITSFVLSMPVSNGSVIITNTTPGKWYLYGGTLGVVAGVVLALVGAVPGSRGAGRASGTTRQAGITGQSGVNGQSGSRPK